MATFDLDSYLGKWYQLAHRPSWFQPAVSYNTTAYYYKEKNAIRVTNSSIVNGQTMSSTGTIKEAGYMKFRVDFPQAEVAKFTNAKIKQTANGQSFPSERIKQTTGPNYIIDRLWFNKSNEYLFSIVTDGNDSLWILSRSPRPSLEEWNGLMQYVSEKFGTERLVLTPHYQ
jgi:lipocalin